MSLDAPIDHPITGRWPTLYPDRLQLYSFPTPNGIKVSAMLEETGLPYEPHKVSVSGDTTTPEFLSLNPNNKIPAIIDPDGPEGRPLALFESGAILIYLGDKTGKLYQRPYGLTCAHCREVMEETTSGICAKRFHASQQASTMAS